MSKHTPGPWSCSTSSDTDRHRFEAQVWDANGRALAFFDYGRTIGEEADANARLIAAAPDLLESLQEALERLYFYCVPISDEVDKKIRDAIAKATGE